MPSEGEPAILVESEHALQNSIPRTEFRSLQHSDNIARAISLAREEQPVLMLDPKHCQGPSVLIIDDFERGDLNPYTFRGNITATITDDLFTTGSKGLELSVDGDSGRTGIYSQPGDGLEYYPRPGDTWEFYVRYDSDNSGGMLFGHDADFNGFRAGVSGGTLEIWEIWDGDDPDQWAVGDEIAEGDEDFPIDDQWIRHEIDLRPDEITIRGYLEESDWQEVHDEISASIDEVHGRGVGWMLWRDGTSFWDDAIVLDEFTV